jgi:hypothetical protein
MTMKAYRVTVEKSQAMYEENTHYSFNQEESTDRIKVSYDPVDVELVEGAEIYDSMFGDKRVSYEEYSGLDLQEAYELGFVRVADYYQITATTAVPPTVTMLYNHSEHKWITGDRHDGTGTTISTREEAESILSGITDTDGLKDIRVEGIEVS